MTPGAVFIRNNMKREDNMGHKSDKRIGFGNKCFQWQANIKIVTKNNSLLF